MSNRVPNPMSSATNRTYILGSASPRRRQLLKGLDIEFSSVAIDADESVAEKDILTEVPQMLAKRKSKAFGDLEKDCLLITADTVVILDNKLINKPIDREEAREMLELLSGREHMVISGVYLRSNEKEQGFSCTTKVVFERLSSEEIDYYVTTYQPLDKAGSYGIQDWIGYIGIRSIEGCYYNVMGLPLNKLYRELCAF